MRKLLSFLLIFSCSIFYSQTQWVASYGGNNIDEALSICRQSNGDIISAGYFTNTINFATGISLTSTSAGTPDIFVMKQDASGTVLWAVKAGGTGSDRAMSVKCNSSGDIFITGFYYGNASFGSTVLNSVNGSQDLFLAKLNASGTFQWAVSGGGAMADWGNAIDIDNSGNILLTGQFQGTSTYGSTTFTSATNPITNFPSFDILIAKYNSSNGSLIWARQGTAKYDDRGLDIDSDSQGNIYVCGQFSDTVTFQNQHNNQIMNAVFLIKYNSNGQEVWFRRASANYSIAYSLEVSSTNDVFISGDFTGNMAFYGSPINFLNATYANKVFIAKYNSSGTYQWGTASSSNNYISARNLALDAAEDLYMFGEFGCTLNEYADVFGQGTFNSVGYQDLFITKFNGQGIRQWMHSYGGPDNDKAHDLVLESINNPIMCGSFNSKINFPVDNNLFFVGFPYNAFSNAAFQPVNYCNFTNYQQYLSIYSGGYTDILIYKGIDINENPYDYYDRNGTNCLRDFVPACIESYYNMNLCPDTLHLCPNEQIYANHHTGHQGGVGPNQRYKWNNSLIDTNVNLTPTFTGYHSVRVTTMDNCYTSEDSIYIELHNNPSPPLISDNVVVNTNSPQYATPIHICGNNTFTITASNIQNNSYNWAGPFLSIQDSTITVNQNGSYVITLTSQWGCKSDNHISVIFDTPLPAINPIQITDSVKFCKNQWGRVIVYDSISNPMGIYPYNCLNITSSSTFTLSPNLYINGPLAPCDLSFDVNADSTGWYHYSISYATTNLCGTNTVILIDSIHITINPNPTANITVSGPQLMCYGDTSMLIASVTQGPNSVNVIYSLSPGDTLITTLPGTYFFNVTATDTITGCSGGDVDQLTLQIYPNPSINTLPLSGLICPNDSVQITCSLSGALNYEWHGPLGLIPGNFQSIYQSIPGFYHCVVTNANGCVLTTNTIELKQYNTPYLIGTPTNIICNGQPVVLHVITNDSSLIVWQAPLFGGNTYQTVGQAGIYWCNATMCNITTACSLQVYASTPIAQITANGPTTICPFDSVMLSATSGMINYQWQPGNYFTPNIYVHQSGSYTVTVTDTLGCSATSAPISVSFTTTTASPNAVGDSICAGQLATLTANTSGGNTLTWYANPNAGPVIGTGTTYTVSGIQSNTNVYVAANTSGGCSSFGTPVTIYVYPSSQPLNVSANNPACSGDSIQLNSNFIPGAQYVWSGPNNYSSLSPSPVLYNADSLLNGVYSVYVSGNGCTSPTATLSLQVIHTVNPIIASTDSICEGNSILLAVNNPYLTTNYLWSGPNNFLQAGTNVSIQPASTNQSGTYSVFGNHLGCITDTAYYTVTVIPLPSNPIISSNINLCEGDSNSIVVYANNSTHFLWNGPGVTNYSDTILILDSVSVNQGGMYTVQSFNAFCAGPIDTFQVQIDPYPTLFIGNDTLICQNDVIQLTASGNYGNLFWFDGSSNNSVSVQGGSIYIAYAFNNSCMTTDSIDVSVVDCDNFKTNIFSPNGDGLNDFFHFNAESIKELHCTIFDRWGVKMAELDSPNDSWDGKNEFSGKQCPNGTYYYVGEIIGLRGNKMSLNGFIQLVRE